MKSTIRCESTINQTTKVVFSNLKVVILTSKHENSSKTRPIIMQNHGALIDIIKM
jgi:hypothetical protein